MSNKRIQLGEAVRFHGHLGPYLVLGILMGQYALRRLKAKKYFGIEVRVKGVFKKPMSCLIDGLQLSTGATFGKGNIKKLNGRDIRVIFRNLRDKKKIVLSLREHLKVRLERLKGHRDSEALAEAIYKSGYSELFEFKEYHR